MANSLATALSTARSKSAYPNASANTLGSLRSHLNGTYGVNILPRVGSVYSWVTAYVPFSPPPPGDGGESGSGQD